MRDNVSLPDGKRLTCLRKVCLLHVDIETDLLGMGFSIKKNRTPHLSSTPDVLSSNQFQLTSDHLIIPSNFNYYPSYNTTFYRHGQEENKER